MPKYITLDNAAEFVGKTVDCHKRLWHYYPLRVVQGVSGVYVVDRNHVMTPINEGDTIFYDYIVEEGTTDAG